MALYSSYTDDQLLLSLKNDDTSAFTEIYERYWATLLAYTMRVIRQQPDAEDIVQELFISIWRRRHTLDIEHALSTYLYNSVRYATLRYIEKDSKYFSYIQRLAARIAGGDTEAPGEGMLAAAHGLRTLHTFLRNMADRDPAGPYADKVRTAMDILEDKRLAAIWDDPQPGKWPVRTLARYDFLLRTRFRSPLETVRNMLSELDVYITVGNQARVNGWGYAHALPAESNIIRIEGLRHPALNAAIGNPITLDKHTNMLFLTGAFARYKRCIFIISTHIVEVGEVLGQKLDNLRFACLPTIMQDGRPRYTYRLQEGIATDRVGMTIIENEKILDIIR
jgi:RNA polymerase sigma factor (sigma-70 family)